MTNWINETEAERVAKAKEFIRQYKEQQEQLKKQSK